MTPPPEIRLQPSIDAPHLPLLAMDEHETLFTPADAPARENFIQAAKLGGVAALGVTHLAATVASARADSRKGQPNRIDPIKTMMSQAATTIHLLGAVKEVRTGLAKRRASKQQ